jgi:hypothetical protein
LIESILINPLLPGPPEKSRTVPTPPFRMIANSSLPAPSVIVAN